MKKSEMYKHAQVAILSCYQLRESEKLDILRLLMDNEDIALYCEKQEEKEAKVTEA